MINGNNARFQIGKETTYGTVAAGTNQIKIASESLKYVADKKNEGLLTGGKAAGKTFTMSKKIEGNISTVAKPDEVGLFLALALGVEANPVVAGGGTLAYEHTFTAIGNGETDNLPSATGLIDRIAEQYSYSGLVLDELSFDASPGDFLKIDCKFMGKEEASSATLATLTPSALKSFRFAHGSYKLQGSTLADVTSIKFNYANKAEALQTSSTGYFFTQAKAGAREITADVEVVYSAASDTIYNTLFKTDDIVSLELTFTSDEIIELATPYSLVITIPNCQINECSVNVGGAETIKQSMKLQAIEEGTDDLIEAVLTNARATKYI